MEYPNLIQDKIHGIEEVIGREAFEKLCGSYGGLDLHIPQTMDTQSAHYLADTIGLEATRALVAWGGSSRVYVPKLFDIELQKRRADIAELRSRGVTYAEIAKTYKYESRYTERQVYAILEGPGYKSPKTSREDGQTSLVL